MLIINVLYGPSGTAALGFDLPQGPHRLYRPRCPIVFGLGRPHSFCGPQCLSAFGLYGPSCSTAFGFDRHRSTFGPSRLSVIGLYVPSSSTAFGFGRSNGPRSHHCLSAQELYSPNCTAPSASADPTAHAARQASASTPLAAQQSSPSIYPTANVSSISISGLSRRAAFDFGRPNGPHAPLWYQPSVYTSPNWLSAFSL